MNIELKRKIMAKPQKSRIIKIHDENKDEAIKAKTDKIEFVDKRKEMDVNRDLIRERMAKFLVVQKASKGENAAMPIIPVGPVMPVMPVMPVVPGIPVGPVIPVEPV